MKALIRILLIVIFFVLVQTDIYSQKKQKASKSKNDAASVEDADRYFNNEEYYLAAQEYSNVLEEEPDNNYALYKLAESDRMFFNYTEAENNYKRLLDRDDNKEYPLAHLWYSLMLKLNGKYEEAEEHLQSFLDNGYSGENAESYKELAKNELHGCKLALTEMKKPQKDYEFQNLKGPVNTDQSDYSPVVFENDSSVVVASSRTESKGEDQYSTLGGKFSDNFRFQKGQNGWEQVPDKDIFSIVHTEYNESPGSFTHDKSKFYFTRCDEVSNQEDVEIHECMIYVSEMKDGKWQKAHRLNENVNMKGEWNAQPSISPKGDTLFFVSKRPGGQGMHDIWMSTSSGKDDWSAAVNLGPEVNTPYIDMSPSYYPKEKTLFFASNGREGFGGLDIYIGKGEGFKQIKNAGLPFNSNRDDFYFTLGDQKGFLASNRDGGVGNDDIYWFNIKGKECVIAEVTKDSLEDARSISVVGKLKVSDSGKPAQDLEILLKNKKGELLKKTRTDETGLFRLENLTPEDYKVLLEDFDPRLTVEVKYIVDKVQVKKSAQVVSRKLFENIYFDFDKYNLRPEGKKVLDELIAYYKANPEIQIEMNANTDAFGSDEYNIHLSEQRGKSSLDYLTANGVKKSALVVNAKGEGKPIATNDNPAGRQLNRRVEFYIVGGPGYEAKAMAYVIEPKTTLYSVAKKFNMTVDELKQLNGLSDEKIMAYRPLRVRRTGDEDIIAPSTINYAKTAGPTDHPETISTSKSKLGKEEPKKKEVKAEKVEKKTMVHHPEQRTEALEMASNEKPQPSPSITKSSAKGEEQYVVEEGDVLFGIAEKYGMTVEDVRKLNRLRTNKLYVGQKLRVMKSPNLRTSDPTALYVVRNGDTMYIIATKFGLTVDELKQMNNLKDNTLYENMVLRVKK